MDIVIPTILWCGMAKTVPIGGAVDPSVWRGDFGGFQKVR